MADQPTDSLRKLAVKIYTQVRDNFQDPTVSFDTGLTNLQQLLASHLQPQAPDEPDDFQAMEILKTNYTWDRPYPFVLRPKKVGYQPSKAEWKAISYLCDEWDWGYEPDKAAKSGPQAGSERDEQCACPCDVCDPATNEHCGGRSCSYPLIKTIRHESEVCLICKKREADSAPKPEGKG